MADGNTDEAFQQVNAVRSLLIAVGTGKREIDGAEPEYQELRGQLGASLRARGIVDLNKFASLWDWYSYWRTNGLNSYQARAEYLSALYKPIVAALEKPVSQEPQSQPQDQSIFSVRRGVVVPDSNTAITIRDEAPPEMRRTVANIMTKTGWDCDDLFDTAAAIGKRPWESPEPRQSGTPSRVQLDQLMSTWEWYLVYDFIEIVCDAMLSWPVEDSDQLASQFERHISDYFQHTGVGWQLLGGKIASRGSEAFEAAIHRALPALSDAGLQTAEKEIHEALRDLSRRPEADLTGAIQHAMAALECVARSAAGGSDTLGTLIKRHPGLIPKPLDAAVEKAWGFASEKARHIQEGQGPSRDEAELIVGIAATVATYLTRKLPH